MKTMGVSKKNVRRMILGILLTLTVAVQAATEDWQRQSVNWGAGGGRRIKAIYTPKDKPLSTPPVKSSRLQSSVAKSKSIVAAATTDANQIDSPPVDGFVPYIAVAITDARSSDDLDWAAVPRSGVVGDFLTEDPNSDFTIGIFDTGAGVHLMSSAGAERTGMVAANLLTTHTVQLGGATGIVEALVSQPLGLFIDGLSAVDPNTWTLNDANMVGESNVALTVGEVPEGNVPDLPTAIGGALGVYFATAIFNDRQITVIDDANNKYTGPDIRFYALDDPCTPHYANSLTLNLTPAGAMDVQYMPDLESIMDLVFEPGLPSAIGAGGIPTQSLFFLDSVDLYKGTRTSLDKHKFMLDTGAQVTVISTSVGARLGMKPATPDFEVEIVDVTGESTMSPGFFIDTLEIPALGDWLSFTHVPVVLLDISSPEGGFLDGIIGTNLFTEYNLILRGGGLLGQDPPALEFERITPPPASDIAPQARDGNTDFGDLAAFASAWLSSEWDFNWNQASSMN